jgi:hypothetical protein
MRRHTDLVAQPGHHAHRLAGHRMVWSSGEWAGFRAIRHPLGPARSGRQMVSRGWCCEVVIPATISCSNRVPQITIPQPESLSSFTLLGCDQCHPCVKPQLCKEVPGTFSCDDFLVGERRACAGRDLVKPREFNSDKASGCRRPLCLLVDEIPPESVGSAQAETLSCMLYSQLVRTK